MLSDGTINLPRLGTVEVWGLTLEEARRRITTGYSVSCGAPSFISTLLSSVPSGLRLRAKSCVPASSTSC